MGADPNTTRPTASPSGAYDPCTSILALLWLVMFAAALPSLGTDDDGVPPTPISGTISPNTAPWWELTVLPRIGEGIAHKIVRYRETARRDSSNGADPVAFACAADLAQVRGIGPNTLQRIGRYLDF